MYLVDLCILSRHEMSFDISRFPDLWEIGEVGVDKGNIHLFFKVNWG